MTRRAALEACALFAALWVALGFVALDGGGAVWAAFATSCSMVSFYYSGLYERRAGAGQAEILSRLALGVPVALLLMAACSQLFAAPPTAATLAVCGSVAPLVIFLSRLGGGHRPRRRERVVLLGVSPLAVKLCEESQRDRACPYEVVGFVEDGPDAGKVLPPQIADLGPPSELGRILRETRPDRIIVTLTSRRGRLPVQVLLKARFRGIAVEDGVDAYERLWGKVAIESIAPSALLFSSEFKKSPAQTVLNRGISVLVAALALLLLAPLLGLIALVIVFDSPGPPLFFQDRVGIMGRCFRLVKFRTMRPRAQVGSEWEQDNRERITRIGRVLRRFRIDELPQLVNVLRGDMNLIGPRPHPVCNLSLFASKIPFYSIRASVLPGLTGWAQVRYGYANGLEEETEKMRYDLYYVKRMSLSLDVRILFETARLILVGRDASAARQNTRVVRFDSRSAALRAATRTRAAEAGRALWSRGA